jgi:adenylate cyclase
MSGDSLGIGDATQSSGPRDRPPLSKDVFISYASQDAPVANSVVEALERQGIRCWIAPRDVTPGEFYAGVIVHAIDAAKATVLILSQYSAASPHVVREVERAASKRHLVISLRIDRAPLPADLEYFLNTSQWLDASEGEPSRVFPKLLDAVRKVLSGGSSVEAKPALSLSSHVSAPSPSARSLSHPVAAVLCLVTIAMLGFAIDKWWFSRHMTDEKPVAASAPAASTAAQVIPEKSVAVLPFLDMSEKKDQEYFSDGLSEELIDMLTKVPDLRVPARTSSFYFKGKQTTIADIAKELGVSHVLEGSVRKSGNTLRITAQLIRVDNGYHLWSETYDRKLDDIFKVQDEIAGAVVTALKVSLLDGATPKAIAARSSEGYNLYLQALSMYVRSNSPTEKAKVAEYLHRTLKADDKFAPAWALLSKELSSQGELKYVDPDKARDEAWRAAQRALELDPLLADAHLAKAKILLWHDWDFTTAKSELNQALVLEPTNSLALSMSGWLAARSARPEQAVKLMEKAIASDPVNPVRYRDLGEAFYNVGNYADSFRAYRKLEDLNPAEYGLHLYVGRVLIAQGDPLAALTESDREMDPNLREQCACRVIAYDALGRATEADAALSRMIDEHADEDAYDIGLIEARRGHIDKAFGWFERAFRQRDTDLLSLKIDPLLKNVQLDPRFKVLVGKLNLPE